MLDCVLSIIEVNDFCLHIYWRRAGLFWLEAQSSDSMKMGQSGWSGGACARPAGKLFSVCETQKLPRCSGEHEEGSLCWSTELIPRLRKSRPGLLWKPTAGIPSQRFGCERILLPHPNFRLILHLFPLDFIIWLRDLLEDVSPILDFGFW